VFGINFSHDYYTMKNGVTIMSRSNTIAACVNVLFIQLRQSITGLAKRSFVLLIFLTSGGTFTARIQKRLFIPSSTKQLLISELAGPLPWELTITHALSVGTLLKYFTTVKTASVRLAAGVIQCDGPKE
jgi:hypothetical protein